MYLQLPSVDIDQPTTLTFGTAELYDPTEIINFENVYDYDNYFSRLMNK